MWAPICSTNVVILTGFHCNWVFFCFVFFYSPSLELIAAAVTPFANTILSWNFLSLNFKWSGLAGLPGAVPILKGAGNVLRGGSALLTLLLLSRMDEPALDWFPVVCFHGGADFKKGFCSNLAFADATDMTFSSEDCPQSWHGKEPLCPFTAGVCFRSNLFLNKATDEGLVLEEAAPFWLEDGLKGAFGGGVLFKVRLICWRSFKDTSMPLCAQRYSVL